MLELRKSQHKQFIQTWEYSSSVDIDWCHSDIRTQVVLIEGDGMGPNVTRAARRVIDAAFPYIEWREQVAGTSALQAGVSSGLPDDTLDAIAETGIVLKGPVCSSFESGEIHADGHLIRLFELYGNLKPMVTLPAVKSQHPGKSVDLLLVSDNLEGFVAGSSYLQTADTIQSLSLTSRTGTERIVRLAFELARSFDRDKVSSAANLQGAELAEGLFRRVFEEVSADYPELMAGHLDLGACISRLAASPSSLDVLVTSNVGANLVAKLAASLAGGEHMVPSANIGTSTAVFGTALGITQDMIGHDYANPTAMILSGVMMLRHIGAVQAAEQIEHALYATLEDGRYLTPDIAMRYPGVTCNEFAKAIIGNLGVTSSALAYRDVQPVELPKVIPSARRIEQKRQVEGFDVFVEWDGSVDLLASKLNLAVAKQKFVLENVSNRGVSHYPSVREHTEAVNLWCCRFKYNGRTKSHVPHRDICELLHAVSKVAGWMHVERLQSFAGHPAYTATRT